jgi:hypothetical protein
MNINFNHIIFIFSIVIICAYIFGIVFVSVFKNKLYEEHFESKKHIIISEEEEDLNKNIKKTQLSKIFSEEEEKNKLLKNNILHEEEQNKSKIIKNNILNEEENIKLFKKNNHNQISNDILEDNDTYVVVKKKFLIENFSHNPNKKDKR